MLNGALEGPTPKRVVEFDGDLTPLRISGTVYFVALTSGSIDFNGLSTLEEGDLLVLNDKTYGQYTPSACYLNGSVFLLA